MRKGIVLAGGSGTRLYPSSIAISKQIIPIYNKPMIYYPISVLMTSDIRDILIISTPDDINFFKKLLGDGSKFGVNFEYLIQSKPNGIAETFLIGKDYICNSDSALILGDNLFYGPSFNKILKRANERESGATIFVNSVSDPERFGVVECDDENRPVSIIEKPENPKSKLAVTGLYFYDSNVTNLVKEIKPSLRGELEITDLNRLYLARGSLRVEELPSGFFWIDAGTPDSLFEATSFVKTIEKKQGILISSPEVIALNKNWISKDDILKNSHGINNAYTNALREI